METAATIRVLCLTTSESGRRTLAAALQSDEIPLEAHYVSDVAAFAAALDGARYDCLLVDGPAALDAARRRLAGSSACHAGLPVVVVNAERSPVEGAPGGACGGSSPLYCVRGAPPPALLPQWLSALVEVHRLRGELACRRQEIQLAEQIFAASDEGMVITDACQVIQRVNPAFCKVTGYAPAEVIGQTPRLLKSGRHDAAFYQALWAQLNERDHWSGEIVNRRKDGSFYREWLSISAIREASGGRVTHYVGIFTDLSERQALEDRLEQLAHYDRLTGLPNRELLIDRLGQAIHHARRHERHVGLLIFDLVRFHNINDSLGHAVGDQVLRAIGRRLLHALRAEDTVARCGADDFAVVLADLAEPNDAIALVQRLHEEIAQPLEIAGTPLLISAHSGVALFPRDADAPEVLFQAADVALQRARKLGAGTFCFYAPGMDADARERVRLEAELRKALAAGTLELFYQPQVSLLDGHVCGYEALLRWHHPEWGPISPARFIPLAEESGLIGRLGTLVIEAACHQNKAWLEAGLPLHPVAVNVSVQQFRHGDLVATIEQALAATGLPGYALEIEITESVFLDDEKRVAALLDRIKALGVRLALDDFGTGYSSLAHLSRLPLDKIKIDQAFVRDITENPVNAAIVRATLALARSLDMTVLAEGVENEAQLAVLRQQHCDAMQGWLFSKALPPDDIMALVRSGQRLSLPDAPPAASQTLLVVDDETLVLRALRRALHREGYQILTTTSPQEAFDLLARHPVQVVISDQRMPEMNGSEFLARVRQLYPETVRIILSGYTDFASLTEAINRGAIWRYLSKPWDDEALRQTLREAFRQARTHTFASPGNL